MKANKPAETITLVDTFLEPAKTAVSTLEGKPVSELTEVILKKGDEAVKLVSDATQKPLLEKRMLAVRKKVTDQFEKAN